MQSPLRFWPPTCVFPYNSFHSQIVYSRGAHCKPSHHDIARSALTVRFACQIAKTQIQVHATSHMCKCMVNTQFWHLLIVESHDVFSRSNASVGCGNKTKKTGQIRKYRRQSANRESVLVSSLCRCKQLFCVVHSPRPNHQTRHHRFATADSVVSAPNLEHHRIAHFIRSTFIFHRENNAKICRLQFKLLPKLVYQPKSINCWSNQLNHLCQNGCSHFGTMQQVIVVYLLSLFWYRSCSCYLCWRFVAVRMWHSCHKSMCAFPNVCVLFERAMRGWMDVCCCHGGRCGAYAMSALNWYLCVFT